MSFDLVGTLANKVDGVDYRTVLEEVGLGWSTKPILEALERDTALLSTFGSGGDEHRCREMEARLRRACLHAGIPGGRLEIAVERLRGVDLAPLEVVETAAPILEELRSRGAVLAVCSNGPPGIAERVRALHLDTYFDALVVSGEAGTRKPCSDIFVEVCDRLSVGPESTVHVGNTWTEDVLGARSAGMGAVYVGTPPWGRPLPRGVRVVRDLDEVPAAVDSILADRRI